jgi:beta-galactosidase
MRLFLLFVSLSMFSCSRTAIPDYFRDADFNGGWQFHMGDISQADLQEPDEAGWSQVQLPHDWSIIDYKEQDSLHMGPFFKEIPGGADVGYLRNGVAWYRKNYITPENSTGKRIIIGFDGVQSRMELWVNGAIIGEHVYGYTPFQFDITDALNELGENNLIAVKTINPGENSRWFTGAGIYRQVSLSMLGAVAIAPWGVYVTTPEVTDERATVSFEIEVANRSASEVVVSGEIVILSQDQIELTMTSGKLSLGANSKGILRVSGAIEQPELWSTEQPRLYRAETILLADGEETDSYRTSFGIRSIHYSADKGFLLNGKELLLKGACMHHANGLLGAAAFPDAEYRRVQRMKANGYNAIRTSHNPPSESFLEACDELGVVVIDEAFDQWMMPKRPNDYSNYFQAWHNKDIQAMVNRDRNHPSVVMWSIGNEIQERADPEGIEIGRSLVQAVKELDDTRPVTQAVCDFWDQPDKDWDYSAGAFSVVDIGGYNYQFLKYEPDHLRYPERLMVGTESVPQHAWENWEMVKRHTYVLGDFVWTGMDYIGESGIGHNYIVKKGSSSVRSFLKPWPWYVSWCGDIDILGNKKPQSHYRDVVWGESNMEMLVSNPVPEGSESGLSYWGWYDELDSWNWEGHEGEPVTVRVYTSLPEVRLELNGEEVGSARIDSADKYTAVFEIPYAPGELIARGFRDGNETESVVLQTTGASVGLEMIEEKASIPARKDALAYINILATDRNGLLVQRDDAEVTVKVSGPAVLQAAGNGSPEQQGSFTDHLFRLYRGRGMVIIRSTGEVGSIKVGVSSRDMEPATVTFEAY